MTDNVSPDSPNQYQEYKGFSLFSDVEDYELRSRNRAVVMANIAENNSRNQRINANGMGLVLGYFNSIPSNERKDAIVKFVTSMKERGFELTIPRDAG